MSNKLLLTEQNMEAALHKAGFAQVSVTLKDGSHEKLWIVRDRERLGKMTPAQLAEEYANQKGVTQ